MKKNIVRTIITAAILAVILIIPVIAAHAATSSASNFEKAVDLKILGLLAPTPDKFELERPPTRVEGAVMLVRFLGKESFAMEHSYAHPFTDVQKWADPYVGYLYHFGLTKGISSTKFGPNDLLTAKQFVTLILRAAGYEDTMDFDYNRALDKALETGLLNAGEFDAFNKNRLFYRNDMAGISYNALSIRLKSSDRTMLDKLVFTDKVVYKPAAKILGLYTSDVKNELDIDTFDTITPEITDCGIVVMDCTDLFTAIRRAVNHLETEIEFDIRGYDGNIADDYKKAINKAVSAVEEVTGVGNLMASWSSKLGSATLQLSLKYRYTNQEFNSRKEKVKSAINKARSIVSYQIRKNMSDYEKEKVLHDYIVTNTGYDYANYLKGTIPEESSTAYGCLVSGFAVCGGYSKAMKLLCDLSALECWVVLGKAKFNNSWEGHSWNIIKIDGSYYHLDVTCDDPIVKGEAEVLVYYYFNLPDTEMKKVCSWDTSKYPACSSYENNYYYKNNLIADTKTEFDLIIQRALQERRDMIELKLSKNFEEIYLNLPDIIFESRDVLKYAYSINKDLQIVRIFDIQYS